MCYCIASHKTKHAFIIKFFCDFTFVWFRIPFCLHNIEGCFSTYKGTLAIFRVNTEIQIIQSCNNIFFKHLGDDDPVSYIVYYLWHFCKAKIQVFIPYDSIGKSIKCHCLNTVIINENIPCLQFFNDTFLHFQCARIRERNE